MKERLKKLYKWKNVTPKRIDELLEVYRHFIDEGEDKIYLECRCPSSLRIMMFDLKKYVIDNGICD